MLDSAFHILTSSPARRVLWLTLVGVLLFLFWTELLTTLGVGVVLLVLAIITLTLVVWLRKFSLIWHWWNLWLAAIVFAAALLGLFAFFAPERGILSQVSLGGNWGTAINQHQNYFTGVGCIIALIIAGVILVRTRFTWRPPHTVVEKMLPLLQQLRNWGQRSIAWLSQVYAKKVPSAPRPIAKPPKAKVKTIPVEAPRVTLTPPSTLSREGWELPGIELLDETVKVEPSPAEVDRRAKLIEEALASYGVEAKVVQVNIGPTVTQFGIEPGWDRKYKKVKERDKNGNLKVRVEEVSRTRVKVERITSLANDLALTLAAPSVRIEAPVPGKSVIGIEVPNSSMRLVCLREVIESTAFTKLSSRSKLALALGKGTAGEAEVLDLAKMPHLLIAGTTGSGKTVCLNSIIVSFLMRNTPEELQFIMIDPKRVELAAFNTVPHLMTPVITEKERAVEILKWLNQEMDSRYRKLALMGARNIDMYNKSSKVAKPMPYIILIIDELADLMIAKSEEVEPLLCRLAQMGRAVGIHLVVATQRPSVDVVTGLIKANFPTRISFAVASQVDSRTILDTAGAEKLLGRGDMLYVSSEMTKPKRLQGCFASPQEIERLVSFWSNQKQAQLTEALVPAGDGSTPDPLLEEARQLAREHKQISASFLQRQLRIGYSRATQLMELLEKEDKVE